MPRLRHPLLPHLPGEPPLSASCSELTLTAWGLGAGIFQLRGFCVQGVTSRCTPLVGLQGHTRTAHAQQGEGSEACRRGSGRALP